MINPSKDVEESDPTEVELEAPKPNHIYLQGSPSSLRVKDPNTVVIFIPPNGTEDAVKPYDQIPEKESEILSKKESLEENIFDKILKDKQI